MHNNNGKNCMSSKIQRINISFPKKLVDDLNLLIPSGRRSRLIVEATKKEVQKVKRLKVLSTAAGAWKDSNHPDLKTIEDIRSWVNQLRQYDEKRIDQVLRKDE